MVFFQFLARTNKLTVCSNQQRRAETDSRFSALQDWKSLRHLIFIFGNGVTFRWPFSLNLNRWRSYH